MDEANDDFDCYEILGLSRDASISAVKAAFRRLAKTAHPDNGGDPEIFRRLKLAHDVLIDPERRVHYDRTGLLPNDLVMASEDAELDALAGDLLINAIAEAGDPHFDDVIGRMRKAALRQIERMRQEVAGREALMLKMNLVFERIESGRKSNRLRAILLDRRLRLDQDIETLRKRTALYHRLLEHLETYRYTLTDIDDAII